LRDQLYLAPLQSFTDHHFRNAFQQVLGDVDRFYAPYLKMDHSGAIKEGPKKDVLPENNPYETVVPQIMACGADDFMVMANYLKDLGYTELNWNLGCPYPMVAKRDLGSGILNKPEKIFSILEEVLPKLGMELGIKMRMGYEDTSDILTVLPRLNDYPLKEVVIHARYGKQLYNGPCDHKRFRECIPLSKYPLVYNGDIRTVEEFRTLKGLFPEIEHWMIGRGAISNPFLFEMIQDDTEEFPEDRMEVFHEFLELLLENHLNASDNEGIVLMKMTHFWEYFMTSFENGQRYYRMVKKADSVLEYRNVLDKVMILETTN
jgi:tRNA-dihydrouridine synthase